MSKNKSVTATGFVFLILAGIWVSMALLVNPIGNFPLNDDCYYGKTVHLLLKEGRFQIAGQVGIPLIAQAFWGLLFCLPFGFSFTALRLSTLCLGLVGIFATYGLLREAKIDRTIAALGALIVATNPIYFELSNTFMSDVPFFSLGTLSLLFFVRAIRLEKKTDFLFGTLFACIVSLIRQQGIIIPLVFGIVFLAKNGINKKSFRMALLPAALAIGSLTIYQIWLQSTHRLPIVYSMRGQELFFSWNRPIWALIRSFSWRGLVASIYLGLFILPFAIIQIAHKWKMFSYRQKKWTVFTLSILSILIGGILLWKKKLMPLSHNILFDIGLGPPTLKDVWLLDLPHLPRAPKIVWLAVTISGVFGASLLLQNFFSAITRLFRWQKKGEFIASKWALLLVISVSLLYFFPIGILGFFDRYLIFLIPLLIFIMADASCPIQLPKGRLPVFIALTILVIYTIFTLGATYDYLSWNRARWKALQFLTAENCISYKKIDGGYEFNGWHGHVPCPTYYNEHYKYSSGKKESWQEGNGEDYIISFGPMVGYDEIKRFSYKRWIPLGYGYILVLKK